MGYWLNKDTGNVFWKSSPEDDHLFWSVDHIPVTYKEYTLRHGSHSYPPASVGGIQKEWNSDLFKKENKLNTYMVSRKTYGVKQAHSEVVSADRFEIKDGEIKFYRGSSVVAYFDKYEVSSIVKL